MTATTAQHIAARNDPDLIARLVATAEQLGIDNAQQVVEANLGKLVSVTVDVGGSTSITEVHAYAADVRKDYLADSRALPPGAVTDPILTAAVRAGLGVGTESQGGSGAI